MNRGRPAILVAVLAVAVLALGTRGGGLSPTEEATGSAPREITVAERAAGLTFDATASQYDRQAVTNAIAAARPEAQRLIAIVDGLVDITIGAAGGSALGMTEGGGGNTNRYKVTLDLARVNEQSGTRGMSRLILHELAHVIDHAILPVDLQDELNAGIPAGAVCEEGSVGACAIREERFAESFAKWATNDIGLHLYIGYKIPPPPSLDAWGAPLATVD